MQRQTISLTDLPEDVIIKVASDLTHKDRYNLRRVNSFFSKSTRLQDLGANVFFITAGKNNAGIFHPMSQQWYFINKNWEKTLAKRTNEKIKKIFTRRNTFFLCEHSLYACGINPWGQLGVGFLGEEGLKPLTKVIFNSDNILDMSLGEDFAFIVDKQHHVYAFGNNTSGELGLSNQHKYVHTPTEVSFFQENPNIRIVKIICGEAHSLFLCQQSGKLSLYGSGDNRDGLVGLPSHEPIFEPQLITFFEDKKILEVTCGGYHTLVFCQDGLYAFGSNIHGQLGLSKEKNESYYSPQAIDFFNNKKIKSIHCSNDFSIVQTDEGFFGFGCNKKGCLGLEESKVYHTPTKIPFGDTLGIIIKRVITGDNFTYFATSNGIYGCGHNKQLGIENKLIECDLVLSTFLDNDEKNDKKGKIYLSKDGEYVVHDFKGKIYRGNINATDIDLVDLDTKIKDIEFKKRIFELISKKGFIHLITQIKYQYTPIKLELFDRIQELALNSMEDISATIKPF